MIHNMQTKITWLYYVEAKSVWFCLFMNGYKIEETQNNSLQL